MNLRLICFGLLVCIAPIAQGQAYKCKQADGSLSFQDQPCQGGGSSSKIALPSAPTVSGEPSGPSGNSTVPKQRSARTFDPRQMQDEQTLRAQEEAKAQNEKAIAFNKMQRCNFARQQLGVTKELRPIYSHDSKGDRQYVPDDNRQATIAAAERRVNAECN